MTCARANKSSATETVLAYAATSLPVALVQRSLTCWRTRAVPRGPLALAEVEGEVRVAVSTDGRKAIADPFHRTLEPVALVRNCAEGAAALVSS